MPSLNQRVNNWRQNANKQKHWTQVISIWSENLLNNVETVNEIDNVLKSKYLYSNIRSTVRQTKTGRGRETGKMYLCLNCLHIHVCPSHPAGHTKEKFMTMTIHNHYFAFRLSDVCEKTRKQCLDIEHDYETFRLRQFATHFFPKSFNSPQQKPNLATTTTTSRKLQRSHSFNSSSALHSSADPSTSANLFDISSATVFKAHLTELKSRIHSLTSDCSTVNERLHQSEQEKRYLIDRITQLERQRRDDNDSLQHELNHCKKLLEKHSNEQSRDVLSNIYSPPEHDVSLYDEVLFEHKQGITKPSYEPTNYKDLFARVYHKLKLNPENKAAT